MSVDPACLGFSLYPYTKLTLSFSTLVMKTLPNKYKYSTMLLRIQTRLINLDIPDPSTIDNFIDLHPVCPEM